MSAGHFGYAHGRVSTFVEELDREIEGNHLDGEDCAPYAFDPKVIEALKAISAHATITAQLMREAGCLYSSDTSPESFLEAFNQILAQ